MSMQEGQLTDKTLKLLSILMISTNQVVMVTAASAECDKCSIKRRAQLEPGSFYLIADMANSGLKRKLEACRDMPFIRTDFSIGHRGACIA